MDKTANRTREIRLYNLELLLDEIGGRGALSKLAVKAGTSQSNLTQVRKGYLHKSTGTPRGLGDDLARRIENAQGKPEGWMDVDRRPESDGEQVIEDERVTELVRLFGSMSADDQALFMQIGERMAHGGGEPVDEVVQLCEKLPEGAVQQLAMSLKAVVEAEGGLKGRADASSSLTGLATGSPQDRPKEPSQ